MDAFPGWVVAGDPLFFDCEVYSARVVVHREPDGSAKQAKLLCREVTFQVDPATEHPAGNDVVGNSPFPSPRLVLGPFRFATIRASANDLG
jgi:hypothetical protein